MALVYPNNDPAAFMTAFYGCLLAEVVPVPIEVPLTRKVSHHRAEERPQVSSVTSTIKHYADDNFVYMTCLKLEFTKFGPEQSRKQSRSGFNLKPFNKGRRENDEMQTEFLH